MFEVKEEEFNTPEGTVYRATLMVKGVQMLDDSNGLIMFECMTDSVSAITGLILKIGRFKTEAIAAISKHLREVEK